MGLSGSYKDQYVALVISTFHHEPFRHHLVVDLCTVHQNSYPINSASYPGREHKTSNQRYHRQDKLPGRNAKGDSTHHCDWRCKRYDRQPDAYWSMRIVKDKCE